MPEDAPQTSRSLWPIAITVICVSLIVLAGYVFKACADKPARMVDSIAKAAQPQITINTIIQTSLDRLRDESKLVVYTAEVSVMVTKFSEKKIFFGKVDLGRTTVRLRAAGNKAQLIVPLKSLSTADFRFDDAENRLTITIPPPRVDQNMVEVQTDPTYYEIETEVGWARLNGLSGDFLRDQAKRDLRPAVIEEASQPRIIEMAKQSAQEKIAALLEPAIKPLRPNATVAVEFKAKPME